jgi:hypothetical protein
MIVHGDYNGIRRRPMRSALKTDVIVELQGQAGDEDGVFRRGKFQDRRVAKPHTSPANRSDLHRDPNGQRL